MTDNEIIKALKECEECHYYNDCEKSTRLALDLINRQKAEIERLTINMNAFGLGMKREKERADNARAEAVNEFAEEVKRYYSELCATERMAHRQYKMVADYIDNLVKEFTEGSKR